MTDIRVTRQFFGEGTLFKKDEKIADINRVRIDERIDLEDHRIFYAVYVEDSLVQNNLIFRDSFDADKKSILYTLIAEVEQEKAASGLGYTVEKGKKKVEIRDIKPIDLIENKEFQKNYLML